MKIQEKLKRVHLSHFHVAGFTYYEGPIVFDNLKIGTQLTMKREADNRHDKHAIALYFEDTKLGFIPRGENDMLAKLLDAGVNQFEVRINRVKKSAHPEEQVGAVLYVLKTLI